MHIVQSDLEIQIMRNYLIRVHQSEIKGGMQNIYQYQLSSSPINLSRERMISRHFNIGLVKPQLDVVKS